MTIALGLVGLVLLVGGAEWLVRGASRLAVRLGISPLIVGLTVVAFGTSAPELAVGLHAAFTNQSDLTVGNVVGSNTFNVLLILGISAVIVPLSVSQRLIRIDVPVMVGVSALLLVLGLNGYLGRLEGALMTAGLAAYIGFAIYESRRDGRQVEEEYSDEFGESSPGGAGVLLNLTLIVAGFVGLVLGSKWLVDAASRIALDFGLSQFLVGLTIVAVGTSLPEVATSIVAAAKGERDIAVGNVVGSNIFNVLAVLGISSLLSPHALVVAHSAVRFDLPVMLAVAIACMPVFFTGLIARWQGLMFLGFYFAYLACVILDASDHDAIGTYSVVMLTFVLPLSGVALVTGYVRHVRMERREARSGVWDTARQLD